MLHAKTIGDGHFERACPPSVRFDLSRHLGRQVIGSPDRRLGQALHAELRYHPVSDFAPVAMLIDASWLVK